MQFCEDPLAASTIDRLGATNVLWGCDYPHSEGTFPHSREIAGRALGGCADADRHAVLVGNPAALYGVDAEGL